MKLSELKQGDRFRFASSPNGGIYTKGGRISGTSRYYVHSGGFVYTGGGHPGDEVIKVEDNEK